MYRCQLSQMDPRDALPHAHRAVDTRSLHSEARLLNRLVPPTTVQFNTLSAQLSLQYVATVDRIFWVSDNDLSAV